MNYNAQKARLAVKWSEDLEQVKAIATRFIDLVIRTGINGGPDNYTLYDVHEGKFTRLTTGSRDFCLGFAEANTRSDEMVICIETTIIWPEERFGEVIS